jgi:hypothetical protein
VTDTPKPTGKSRRKDASREPATIDLQATVLDEGVRDERTPAEAERTEVEAPVESAASSETSPDERAAAAAGEEAAGPAASEPSPGGSTPPREPERRGAGFGSLAAAGLLGGVIGAGLLYGIGEWRAGQRGQDPRFAEIEQRLAGLARQDAVRALDGRIGAMDKLQVELAARVQAAQGLAERSATQAQEALSQAQNRPTASAEAAPSAPAPDNAPALADLGSRVSALEEQVRGAAQGVNAAAQGATAAADAAKAAVQALEPRVVEQEQRLGQTTERLSGLDRRLSELDQRLSSFDQRSAGLDQQIGSVDQKVAALAKQVAEGGSDATRAGTRVVLADRLDEALRDGAPYAEELAALRRLAPDDGKFAPLEPFAERGAPTAASLAQSFKPIGERMIRDTRQGSDGWTDRLARMAERIVTVRSVGDPNATDVPSLVARIEAALNRNAVKEAVAAFDALPEPARRIAGDWAQTLKQRAAAEAAARTVSAEAVAALNPPTR